MSTCADCCDALCTARDAVQKWEDELAATLSKLKLTKVACTCVWQSRTRVEHVEATVRRDDILVCGTRPAVERLIKMISRKHEIKKPVIGKDTDLERSGKILNRVIGWVVTASQWRRT